MIVAELRVIIALRVRATSTERILSEITMSPLMIAGDVS
jgi:hypothetical protein